MKIVALILALVSLVSGAYAVALSVMVSRRIGKTQPKRIRLWRPQLGNPRIENATSTGVRISFVVLKPAEECTDDELVQIAAGEEP